MPLPKAENTVANKHLCLCILGLEGQEDFKVGMSNWWSKCI